jgi:hypothetical protein
MWKYINGVFNFAFEKRIIGENPDRKNCDDLELDLNERELTVILSGSPTPIPINIIRLPSAEL